MIDDIIQETTDVDALQEQREQARLVNEMREPPRERRPRASLNSVVSFEKTDIQLWLDAAILVVLLLILMRL